MNIIYVVRACWGKYDDYTSWAVAASLDKSLAEKYITDIINQRPIHYELQAKKEAFYSDFMLHHDYPDEAPKPFDTTEWRRLINVINKTPEEETLVEHYNFLNQEYEANAQKDYEKWGNATWKPAYQSFCMRENIPYTEESFDLEDSFGRVAEHMEDDISYMIDEAKFIA